MNDNCTQTLPDETVDIVCPCFNPPAEIIEHVSSTLGTLRKMFPQTRLHLIVVNDGSTRKFDNEKQKRFLSVIEDSEILNLEHGGKGCDQSCCRQRQHHVCQDQVAPYDTDTSFSEHRV